jgi:hypothetical protein
MMALALWGAERMTKEQKMISMFFYYLDVEI